MYIVINRNDLHGLLERVNEMIELGYKPIGGIAIQTDVNDGYSTSSTFYQAMIKPKG